MRVIHVSHPEFFGTTYILSLHVLPSKLKTQALDLKDRHKLILPKIEIWPVHEN
jgi:hypothetical protein